jgi:acetolactate synthase-1/2/3 large subunit
VPHTTAHYLLQGLTDVGVDYIFSNFGTDHVSIIEELARWDAEGRVHPEVILCPHENVAIHMAGGYAMASGRGQAVMVHVDAGTANAAMGMHNLFRSRVPVALMAGKAPYTMRGELPGSRDNFVHFVQDPFDINSIVRPYVKWEYSLSSGLVAKEVVRRAHAVMQSDPPGPVFLTLPRETLAEECGDEADTSFSQARYGEVAHRGVDPETATSIASKLMAADNPVAVTAYLGRNPQAVAVFAALAEECGIRVIEFGPLHLNFPRDSACFAGFDAKEIEGADLGLLIDVDVPFLPKYVPQGAQIEWLQIDVDAIKRDMPMWGFRADLRIEADSARVLAQVLDAVRANSDDAFRERVRARKERWEKINATRRRRVADDAQHTAKTDPLTPSHVLAQLQKQLASSDVVVNEAIRNGPAVLAQLLRTQPGTYFASGGGGLGCAGGLALGIKLAKPHARVVTVVGDGSFHFGTYDSVFTVAHERGLPILVVVLDNRGWQAVKEATLRVYPRGAAAASDRFQSVLQRPEGDSRRFDQMARAFGAHAEFVDTCDGLAQALKRCVAAVDNGQAALLHVRVAPH